MSPPPPKTPAGGGGGGGGGDSPESIKSCSSTTSSSDDPPPPPLPTSFVKDIKSKSSTIESNLAYKYSLMENTPSTTTSSPATATATASNVLDPNDPMMKYRGLLVSLNPEFSILVAEGMVRQQMAEDGVHAHEIDRFFDPSLSLSTSSQPQTINNMGGAGNNGSSKSTSSFPSSSSLLAKISRRISSIRLFGSNSKVDNKVEDASTSTAGKDENKAPPLLPPPPRPPPPLPPPASASSNDPNTLTLAANESRDDNNKSNQSLLKRMSRAISKAVGVGSSKKSMTELAAERSDDVAAIGDDKGGGKEPLTPPPPQITTTNACATDENSKWSGKTEGSRPLTDKSKEPKQDIPAKKNKNSPSPPLGSLDSNNRPPPQPLLSSSLMSDVSVSDEGSIASQASQTKVVVGGRRFSMVNRSRASRNSVLLNNNNINSSIDNATSTATTLENNKSQNSSGRNSRSNSPSHLSNSDDKMQGSGGIMRSDNNNNSPKVYRNRMNVTFEECANPSSPVILPGGRGGETRNNEGGHARSNNEINKKGNNCGASIININDYNTKYFREKSKKESEAGAKGGGLEAEIRSLFGVYSKHMRSGSEYDPNILAMMVAKRKLEVSLGYSLNDETLAVAVNNEMNRSLRADTPTRGSAIQEVYDQLVPLEVSASKSFHSIHSTNQYITRSDSRSPSNPKKDIATSSGRQGLVNLFQMQPEADGEAETPKKASPKKLNYFNPNPNANFSTSSRSFSDDKAVFNVLNESKASDTGVSNIHSNDKSNNSSLFSPYKLNQEMAAHKHATRTFKHTDLASESKATTIRAMSPTESSMRRVVSRDASTYRDRYVPLLEESDISQRGREVVTAQEKVWMMAAQRSMEKPREGVKGDVAIIQGAFVDAKKMLREFDSLAHKQTWEALS